MANIVIFFYTILNQLITFVFATSSSNRLSTMRIERDATTHTITFHPAEGRHSGTVILMHGLGDSGEGLMDFAQMWARELPHVKFILPTAHSLPLTIANGKRMNAWYDITGMEDKAAEPCKGIEASVDFLKTILNNEKRLGLPYSRMMLAGFSQGGSMSLFAGLQLHLGGDAEEGTPLAGLLVMSGLLPGANKFQLSEGVQDVPVMHLHGDADPVVRPQWAAFTERFFKSRGLTDYTLKFFSDVGHTVSMSMVTDALNFIKKCLPEDPALTLSATDKEL